MKTRLSCLAKFFLGLSFLVALSSTAGSEQFYEGKTIRFIVGSKPGGGFDIMTRAIAHHISKHIAGNPSTVVDYMPGAGHLILVRYMYERAKPDGLTIANFIGQMILGQQLGLIKDVKIDFRDFGWLGIPMQDQWACVLSKRSGISSIEDWKASNRPIKIGGDAPGNGLYDFPQVLRGALQLPTQVIGGYTGSAPIMLAIESGEIDGGCWTWQVMRVQSRHQLDAGDIRVLLQLGPELYHDLKHVPLAINLAKTDMARKLIEAGIHDQSAITRPYSVPPKIPPDRLKILQKAFMDTMRDPEFLADAKRLKLDINPIDGLATARIVARTYELDPEVLLALKQAILGKQQK